MRTPLYSLALIPVAAALISSCGGSAVEPTESLDPVPVGDHSINRLQTILERGTLRVGTTGDFFASYQDPETGERSGFDIDLTRRLAEDMGVAVEYVPTDWVSLVTGLTSGRYDLTTGVSYNSGRAQTALYSRPILRTGTVALTRASDTERFATWELMNQPGVVVSVRQGSMIEEHARLLLPQPDIRPTSVASRVQDEVLPGWADVTLTTLIDAAAALSSQPSVGISEAPLQQPNYIGFLIRQGDHALRAYIDNWLVAQEYSGRLAELIAEWNLEI